MNLDDIDDRLAVVKDLTVYAQSIIDRMAEDSDIDINDWRTIYRFYEKLFALHDFMSVENRFDYALYEMNNMKQSDEDSKWTFPLEKELNMFVKECLMGSIDTLIDCSRSWSFEDYRARNFQDELRQKMTMLKDWYAEEYELND
ncbi:MAG: hypothetical protein IKO74_08730 [Selenomonadaceae bacterium]|nr:hypothetical protein [Selenomonadaceae bacterium]